MDHFITACKQAAISLYSKLQFSATVIITLALTMGMLIAIFHLNYLLIAKPLPYPDEHRLVSVWIENHHTLSGKSYEYNTPVGLTYLYNNQEILESQALLYQSRGLLASHPQQPNLPLGYISHEYLTLLGATYVLGGGFAAPHQINDKVAAVVISYDTWSYWFNQDQDIVGQVAQIGDTQFKIIGVLAENFVVFKQRPELDNPQIWLPWSYLPLNMINWNNSFSALGSIAKVAENTSIAAIEGELSSLLQPHFNQAVANESSFKNITAAIKTTPLKQKVIGEHAGIGYLLFAAAFTLLLIACSNIINLFFSRAIEKSRTLAIQAAVGAKPKHIFISMFSESLLLMALAIPLSLIVCAWCFELLRRLAENQLPRLSELSIDGITIIFATALSLLLALVFSYLSTRVLNYQELQQQLQTSGKGSGLQIRTSSRNCLVIAQVTLTSLMLLATSMLMDKSITTIQHPVGFNHKEVLTFELEFNPKPSDPDETNALLNNIATELQQLPSIEAVAKAIISPIRVGSFSMALRDEAENDLGSYQINRVDSNYFDVIGLPLLTGNTFQQVQDINQSNSNDIILSKSAAIDLFGTTDVVGNNLKTSGNTPLKIIGVVGDIFNPYKSNQSKGIKVYFKYAPWKIRLLVKPRAGVQLTRQQLNDAIGAIVPGTVVKDLLSLADIHQTLLFKYKLIAGFVFGLSILALVLAGAGIYGVLNYSTQMRRYELAVRMSLGAKPHTLIQMIMKDNLLPIAIGMITSLVVALLIYALARQHIEELLQPQLLSVTAATAIMVIVAMLACYIPVRKIVAMDPIKALRYE